MKQALAVIAVSLALTAAAGQHAIEQLSERGPVTARVQLQPVDAVIGDALTLILEVVAEPEVEVLMPEFGQALDRFAIVDFVPRQQLDEDGRTVSTQRYTLQPPRSGPLQIPPIMIEFVDRRAGQQPAPEGEDAYELLTERLAFEVQSVMPQDAAPELKPALGELGPREGADRAASAWPWLLGVGAAALALAPFAWRYWQALSARRRRRSAYDVAFGRLRVLLDQPHPDAAAMKPFFMELSGIVRSYLEDRFALHAPELTTEEFLDIAASSPDLTREHQGFLRDFLQRADQVKFARHIPDDAHVADALAVAEHFLRQTKPVDAQTVSVAVEPARA